MSTPGHLPSIEEIESAKNIIRELEINLESARQAKALDVIDELENKLRYLREWTAPIHRIPFEILSRIFIEASKIYWKTPFLLQAVSRSWRRSLLDTPEAWSFIPLRYIKNIAFISEILTRSVPYPINIKILDPGDSRLVPFMYRYMERIHFLATVQFEITSGSFPNLTTLLLIDRSGPLMIQNPQALLDAKVFPRLQHLHGGYFFDSMEDMIPHYSKLSPITELTFATNKPKLATSIIQTLAHQLVSLYIFFSGPEEDGFATQLVDVEFPKMATLIIMQPHSYREPQWLFEARTPALKTYSQDVGSMLGNIHKDTKSVEHLRFWFWDGLDFQLFPNLRTIVSVLGGIEEFLDGLEAEPQSWLKLEAIICDQSRSVEARLRAFNHKNDRNISWIPRTGGVFLPNPALAAWTSRESDP